MEEKENKVVPTEETSLEQDTESTEEESATTEETEEDSQDIDYSKELETLEEQHKPKRSEKEKAIFTAKNIAKRLKELDVDPSEIFETKKPKKEEPQEDKEISADDIEARIEARLEAKRLARSEDEAKLIMWYVENKGLSVSDAHVLANKGRVKTFIEEQKRGNVRTEQGSNASGRKTAIKHELPEAEQRKLIEQGFKKNADGSFEGKKMKISYDTASRAWKSVKK
jgi:hypothetical protein